MQSQPLDRLPPASPSPRRPAGGGRAMNRVGLTLAVVLVFLGLPAPSAACSIPVFRYALERWKPSPYEVLVFHKGPLADPAAGLLRQLEELKPPVNLTITP